MNARQRRDVPAAALEGELDGPREPVARLATDGGIGMVGGERDEVGGGLEEHIGELEPAVAELARQLPGRRLQVGEDARGPEVRPAFEQADVDPLEAQHGDQVE